MMVGVCTGRILRWEFIEDMLPCNNCDYFQACSDDVESECNQDMRLLGNWVYNNKSKKYESNGGFSAIYDSNDNYVQVINSDYVILCNEASFCFIGQGDIESEGDLYAYCPPPELLNEKWYNENKHRIKHIDDVLV